MSERAAHGGQRGQHGQGGRGGVAVAAVDLGATSGRVVLAEVGSDSLRLEVVARFPNDPVRTPDALHWDVAELHRQVVAGVGAAGRAAPGLASVGIDTWAVDYGLLRDGHLVGTPHHYRDESRLHGVERAHEKASHERLFERTGIQFLPFNTVYQLSADPLVDEAEELLLMPDLFGRWLTGQSLTERTVASTTGLLDVHSRGWDDGLIETLGLPRRLFGDLVDAGTVVGPLLPDVASTTGLSRVPVVAVGSHDTASAVVGTPLTGDAAYVSCGTWGLVGFELDRPVLTGEARAANFTNEAGVDGTTRFLTNVMGLWLLSESVRVWDREGPTVSLPDLLSAAAALPWSGPTFDVQDPAFVAPGDLPSRIRQWYVEAGLTPPSSRVALVRAIMESLAQGFAEAVHHASTLSGRPVTTINLVGGGALNPLLCQALADRSGLPVEAGPVEATALGNVLVQARAAGALRGDLAVLRDLVRRTQTLRTFTPHTVRTAAAAW